MWWGKLIAPALPGWAWKPTVQASEPGGVPGLSEGDQPSSADRLLTAVKLDEAARSRLGPVLMRCQLLRTGPPSVSSADADADPGSNGGDGGAGKGSSAGGDEQASLALAAELSRAERLDPGSEPWPGPGVQLTAFEGCSWGLGQASRSHAKLMMQPLGIIMVCLEVLDPVQEAVSRVLPGSFLRLCVKQSSTLTNRSLAQPAGCPAARAPCFCVSTGIAKCLATMCRDMCALCALTLMAQSGIWTLIRVTRSLMCAAPLALQCRRAGHWAAAAHGPAHHAPLSQQQQCAGADGLRKLEGRQHRHQVARTHSQLPTAGEPAM